MRIAIFPLLLIVMTFLGADEKTAPKSPPDTFYCHPEKKDDQALISVFPDQKITVDITSAKGIGRATLGPSKDASWPERIVIRLKKFKRLEGFTVRAGGLELHSALGQKEMEVRKRLPDGTAKDLPADAKYGMEIRQEGADIEVMLPAALWAKQEGSEVRELWIQWIDAYRE